MSGQEGKNLSTQSIDSKKSWSAIEFARPQVTQEFVHERRSRADRTMNRVSNLDDTRRRSSSGQSDFLFHLARSNAHTRRADIGTLDWRSYSGKLPPTKSPSRRRRS